MGPLAFPLLMLLAPAGTPPAGRPNAQARRPGPEVDAVVSLEAWIRDFQRAGVRSLGLGWESELRDGIAALRAELAESAGPDRRAQIRAVLLDLSGVRARSIRSGDTGDDTGTLSGAERDARRLGRRALDKELRGDDAGEVETWLAQDVLIGGGRHPLERRLAALELLRGRHLPRTMLALFTLAAGDEPELRGPALEALVGWPSPLVHRFLIDQLLREERREDPVAEEPIRRHFAGVTIHARSRLRIGLREYLDRGLGAHDWRRAVRAVRFADGLDELLAVPALIEGLKLWVDRSPHGLGSRRVEGDILRQLERRSGLQLGRHPMRWLSWWTAVREGRVEPGPVDDGGGSTRVGFFGLRPRTDRVVFVIDRSGSMREPFGTIGHSRFTEAVDQMVDFLEWMGPETEFRVILFDEDLRVSSRELRRASEKNLAALRNHLDAEEPEGGTLLRPAIEEALRVGRDGRIDLRRLEADTVIVLCDGETSEGPSWVGPFLERANEEACMVFHCVQIGSPGDGSLEQLARRTGGRFNQIMH